MRFAEYLNEAKKPTKFLSQEKKLVNPKPSPTVLRELHNLLDSDIRSGSKIHVTDEMVIDEAKELIGDFVARLKKEKLDALPLTYRNPHGGYAYTITGVNPLKITTSDGGELKQCKYFSDIGEWAEGFLEDVMTMDFDWARERFSHKSYDQERHEGDRLKGE